MSKHLLWLYRGLYEPNKKSEIQVAVKSGTSNFFELETARCTLIVKKYEFFYLTGALALFLERQTCTFSAVRGSVQQGTVVALINIAKSKSCQTYPKSFNTAVR